MRKAVFLFLAVVLLCSHDLYLKMDSYFLQPGQQAQISLYNGTFDQSENLITRDRMLDATVLSHGTATAIDSSQWKDQDSTITYLNFTAGKSGTYVTGVSTKARNIELTATKFNEYLEHDGVLDLLEQRKQEGLLDQDAVEQYSKHVKAIYQVGEERTDDWSTVLGYPIEFVPQENPYNKYTGDDLKVQLLLDGKPLANQWVYAHHLPTGHSHEESASHSHDGKEHAHSHDSNDDSHSHDHKEASTHSHEHSHDGEAHAHSHDSNDDTHSHDHNEASTHSHSHSHGGEAHTHSHDSNDDTHSHDHNEASTHNHQHSHDAEAHAHSHDSNDDSHGHDHKEANTHKHDDNLLKHSHADEKASDDSHTHTSGQQLRTDDQGILSVALPEDGIYYLRTIHMTTLPDDESLTHQSQWATLSFEVTHQHGADTHTHDDDHEHDAEIPTWLFVLGSILIIGVLFIVFIKNSSDA